MQKKRMTFGRFGQLVLQKEGQILFWFGDVDNLSSKGKVELSIWNGGHNPEDFALHLIEDIASDIDVILANLYSYMYDAFSKGHTPKSEEELKQMYSLTALKLKSEHELWITLEPGDVETIFNFFLRFTLIERKIVWANI